MPSSRPDSVCAPHGFEVDARGDCGAVAGGAQESDGHRSPSPDGDARGIGVKLGCTPDMRDGFTPERP